MLKATATYITVKNDLDNGTGLGIVEEGEIDVDIDRFLKNQVERRARKFFAKFDADAPVTSEPNGVFTMKTVEDGKNVEYVFNIHCYDVGGQLLFAEDVRELGKAIWFKRKYR